MIDKYNIAFSETLLPKEFVEISEQLQGWVVKPNATEGYRTAEVTLGEVDCDSISSKTMDAHNIPDLFFTGEVLDVSGWLGGYNLQWAWSSRAGVPDNMFSSYLSLLL